jgi:8-oxo-dGTP pyrophosphatase MutT (NUDIX family)
MSEKLIQDFEHFEIINIDGTIGIRMKDTRVAVLPFERGQDGLPANIGVINEFNPLRLGSKEITAITGRAEGDDPDILSTAKRELTEEAGYDVVDTSRWTYLGEMFTNKMIVDGIQCFAVDVTGLKRNTPKGDGSLKESKSEFNFLPVSVALDVLDAHIPAIFMRMFKFVFNKELNTKNTETVNPALFSPEEDNTSKNKTK